MPCILQTKKRYVGFSYESLEQKEPNFDAKGIETVRRDGCPAVAKVSKMVSMCHRFQIMYTSQWFVVVHVRITCV